MPVINYQSITINDQLEPEGLRLASEDEAGWFVVVEVSPNDYRNVWVTNLKDD